MIKLPIARNTDIVVQSLKDEFLVFDLLTNEAFCLNDTSAKVFNACDGMQTFDDLKRHYNFSEDLIYLCLDQLKEKDLIKEEVKDHFPGLSRREVIRRVGMASTIALPAIAGIVAPRAAHAASLSCRSAPGNGLNNNATGCPCTSAADCCGACLANACAGANNIDSAAVCFGIVCLSAPGSGLNNNVTGCPCVSAADCCGFCSAGVCAGGNNVDSAPSCP